MAEKKIKLSIIILSWNTKELLRKCLESLEQESKRAKEQEMEIIVVDNGSTDGSLDILRQFKAQSFDKLRIDPEQSRTGQSSKFKVDLILNRENLGFARGNNQGIKKAKGEYIMLLNSDTVVKEGAITRLITYLDTHQEIDVVGPKLLNKDGSVQESCGRFPNLTVTAIMLFKEHFGGSRFVRWPPEDSTEVDWLMGAAFLARKEVFQKIGGLDEKLFMYMEEVEWFYRARQAGFKAFFLKEAEIVHLGRGSSVSGKKEPILNIYKGILYFYRKHKSPIELFILRIMLKLKALLALILGWLKNDKYLKETYGQAIKIS